MNERSTLQGKRPRHWAWLLGCLTLSMLVGSMTAKGATGEACGESLGMVAPVVAVIDGPGEDAVSEQLYWLSLYDHEIHAPDGMGLGASWFQLVRTP